MTLSWKISTIALILLASVFVLLSGREYIHMLSVASEIRRVEGEKADLEGEKSVSLQLIQDLSSTYYVEKEGRTKQGLAAPGETVVVVTNTREHSADNVDFAAQKASNPRLWFLYFFRKDLLPDSIGL